MIHMGEMIVTLRYNALPLNGQVDVSCKSNIATQEIFQEIDRGQ